MKNPKFRISIYMDEQDMGDDPVFELTATLNQWKKTLKHAPTILQDQMEAAIEYLGDMDAQKPPERR